MSSLSRQVQERHIRPGEVWRRASSGHRPGEATGGRRAARREKSLIEPAPEPTRTKGAKNHRRSRGRPTGPIRPARQFPRLRRESQQRELTDSLVGARRENTRHYLHRVDMSERACSQVVRTSPRRSALDIRPTPSDPASAIGEPECTHQVSGGLRAAPGHPMEQTYDEVFPPPRGVRRAGHARGVDRTVCEMLA